MPSDSMNKPIHVGDVVRFRGEEYTIKAFCGTGSGRFGCRAIVFHEPIHVTEAPDEISVDFVRRPVAQDAVV